MTADFINNNRDVKATDNDGNRVFRFIQGVQNSGSFGEFDEIAVTYPTTTTEVYDYLLSSTSIGTVTVTYATSSKKDITNVVWNAV